MKWVMNSKSNMGSHYDLYIIEYDNFIIVDDEKALDFSAQYLQTVLHTNISSDCPLEPTQRDETGDGPTVGQNGFMSVLTSKM